MNNTFAHTGPEGAIEYAWEPPLARFQLRHSPQNEGAHDNATGSDFYDLPRRTGLRPRTLRGPLHIQCDEHGDPHHLDQLTNTVLSWPYVEKNLPNGRSSNTIPLRLEETAAGYNFAAFTSPREFGRVLTGAPTIYMALPLVCAHWAIVRGWAEPHFLSSHGLMPPGALVVYTPRDEHESSVCYSLFVAAYTAASNLSSSAREVIQ
ncbi:MAG: hypothetical protein JOZ08_18285 [Verrucomicrobia bacterium]|nr:hypothetical protein [Verrucomicrobiota bacterium]